MKDKVYLYVSTLCVAEELKKNIQQVISNISQRRAVLNISKCVNKMWSLPTSRMDVIWNIFYDLR
jgi:hypothetical protein